MIANDSSPNETPNETLYINNLNDRIKPNALKRSLIPLCDRFGKLIDLIAMKSLWRKGQAWVVYDSVAAAMRAKQALNGYVLHDKPMQVTFAKTKSDITLKKDGQPLTRVKKPRVSAEVSAARIIERARIKQQEHQPDTSEEPFGDIFKTAAHHQHKPIQPVTQPNKTLFAEQLTNITADTLQTLFSTFEGFERVRLIAARQVAFIDFTNEQSAGQALHKLNGHLIDGVTALRLSYAKK